MWVRFSVELPTPYETYLQLVEQLAVVEGFVRISASERYSLTIEVGRCFQAQAVCEAVANCLLRHLYPGNTALVQLEADHDTRCTVSRCPLHPKGNMPYQKHPHWHPDISDAARRKHLFRKEYRELFNDV